MSRWTFVLAVLLAPVAAGAQSMIAKPGEVGWTDTDTGCLVWNPEAHANETVTWSGPCVDRHATGKGQLVWRRGGRASGAYDGDMVFGHLNGPGVFRFANGDRYEGVFTDDKLNGRGVLTTAEGNEYRGEFLVFRMNGRGVFRYKNGDRYEGEFRNDLPNGQGRAVWANGTVYDGQFRDGVPDGKGTYRAAAQTYSGTWNKGCFRDGNRAVSVMVDPATCP